MLSFCVCLFCSGATKECAWRTVPAPKAWTEVGVCGLPGKSAAGRVEAESPLQSGTVTAPGTGFYLRHFCGSIVTLAIVYTLKVELNYFVIVKLT